MLILTDLGQHKHSIFVAGIALFVILQAVLYFYGEALFKPVKGAAKLPVSQDAACDLQRSSCSAGFAEKGKITFSLSPKPVKPLVPLALSVEVEDLEVLTVHVQFEGIDMYMGYYRPELALVSRRPGKSLYRGNATLSVCTLENMPWRATVIMTTAQGLYMAPFEFVVSKP